MNWTSIITPILMTGNPCYVSGKSATLYSLGKGLYHPFGFNSRTLCFARTLDPFKEEHILIILDNCFAEQLSDEDRMEIAKIIYKLTAGIPRFVQICIDFISKNIGIAIELNSPFYDGILQTIQNKAPHEGY